MFVRANNLKTVEHRTWCKQTKEYGKVYVLVNKNDVEKYISTGKPKHHYDATFIIKDNKPQYIFGDVIFGECKVMCKEREKSLLETMAAHNLKVSDKFSTLVSLIDPEKMLFSINGKNYTADEVRQWKLKPGEAFLYYYDNGYSYIGTEPANSPASFVDGAIRCQSKSLRFSPVDIFGFRYKRDFTCEVIIGEDKSWSEISNT